MIGVGMNIQRKSDILDPPKFVEQGFLLKNMSVIFLFYYYKLSKYR